MGKITEAINMMKDASEVKELVDLIIPEVYPYLERLSDGIVDLKTRQIHKYQDKGFTREEAILLTIDTFNSIQRAINDSTGGK